MRIGNRRFVPKPWAIVLYLVVLSCMLFLGNWQLERAALKVTLQEAAQTARQGPAVPLSTVTAIDKAAAQYQRVSLQGRYDPQRQFLWDNRVNNAQAGFEVISLLRRDQGDLVLINRGWIAPGESREDLPDAGLPADVLSEPVYLEGYLSRPSQGFASGDAVTGGQQWPRLLQYFDYEAIAAVLGEPIVPAVVQVQSVGIDAATTTVLTPRPEWLTANWQPAASGPAKHYSYAFQWFTMAAALTGIFLVVNTRKNPTQGHTDDPPTNEIR